VGLWLGTIPYHNWLDETRFSNHQEFKFLKKNFNNILRIYMKQERFSKVWCENGVRLQEQGFLAILLILK
jgi:hypothetical protein